RLEIDFLQRPAKTDGLGDRFLSPLLEYVSDKQGARNLVGVMDWTYRDNPDGRGTWAPEWTSGGNTLQQNQPIRVGLDRLVADARAHLSSLAANLQLLTQLAGAVRTYQAVETTLAAKANIKDDPDTSDREVAAALDKLQASKAAMEEKLAAVRHAGLFEDGP